MRILDIRIGAVHCGRLPAPEDTQPRNKDTSKVDAFQTVEEEEQQYKPAVFVPTCSTPLQYRNEKANEPTGDSPWEGRAGLQNPW